jgi:hypothetical protein
VWIGIGVGEHVELRRKRIGVADLHGAIEGDGSLTGGGGLVELTEIGLFPSNTSSRLIVYCTGSVP